MRDPKLAHILVCIWDKGQGTRDKGQGTRDKGQGTRDKGQGTRDKGQGTRDKGQGTRDKGQGTRDKGQGTRDKGQGTRDKGQGTRDLTQKSSSKLLFFKLLTGLPELLAKKLGENIKKPRRSTRNRFKICQKSQTEISAI